MTFAALRQTVLQAGCLSTDLFAEQLSLADPGDASTLLTVIAKVEHEDVTVRRRGNTGSNNESQQNTLNDRERIRVTLSRAATFDGSYPTRPPMAATLIRSEARDPDQRPFAFRGEILFEGDQHAVYMFERPRRVVQGKGN